MRIWFVHGTHVLRFLFAIRHDLIFLSVLACSYDDDTVVAPLIFEMKHKLINCAEARSVAFYITRAQSGRGFQEYPVLANLLSTWQKHLKQRC